MRTGNVKLCVGSCVSLVVIALPILPAVAGASAPEIVIPEAPTAVECSAADELADGIRRMTGVKARIVREGGAGAPEMRFYVGQTARSREIFGESPQWVDDEIAVRSVADGLILDGHPQRGPIYAVDTYLETVCGVRWWTSDEADYPRLSALPVKDVAIRHASPFKYRETYYLDALDPRFKVRLKGNFTSRTKCQLKQPGRIPSEWGGDSAMHFFEKRASAYHSVLQILPPAKYHAEHPDWYVVNEKKEPRQLCLTHPEMRKAFIAELDAILAAHPETDFIQVSQEDTTLVCPCAACRAAEAEEGSVSGVYLRFVNAVAEALEAKHPKVTFDTFAYRFTRRPPKKTRPRKNVTVRLCDIECAFNAPLVEMATNSAFVADLEGWSRLASGQLYIWDYVTDFTGCLLPHPNLAALAPNIRLFARNGAVGVFEQGDSVSRVGSLAPYRVWMLAHLLWNPAADEKKLRDDFLAGYYGPHSAPYLRTFLESLDHAGQASALRGVSVSCYHANVTSFWTKAEALAACAAVDEAFEAARTDGDVYARRVDRERLATDLVRLLNWRDWNLGSEPERLALWRSWYTRCRALGVKAYREAYGAADFETCAAAVRRGVVPESSCVPKPKAPGKPGFVWAKPFPTRNLQPHSSFEAGFRPHGANVTLPFGADMVQPRVAVDETTAVHGRRSLRIDNTQTDGEVQLQMADVEVAGERPPFVVSAYVKADRPTKVRLGVERIQFDALASGSVFRKGFFEIGTEWQRIELRDVRVSAPVTGFNVQLTVASEAVVWVDAVQVESGTGPASDYAPSAPIEAAFEADLRVLSREDDVTVDCGATLRACTYADEPQDLHFNTDAGAFALRIEPGRIAERRVGRAVTGNGRVTFAGTFATATHGVTGVVAPDETAVVAAVPLMRPSEGFRVGVNGTTGLTSVKRPNAGFSRFREYEKVWRGPLGYRLDDYYRDLRRGGWSIVRFHDGAYAWEDIEREKGVFDWSKMDVIENGMRKNGLDPMFVFASHGVFRTKAKGDGPETNWFVRVNSRRGGLGPMSKGKKRERLVYYHPKDGDWTDWVTAAVTRYHGLVRLWEIVNEPNGTMESAAAYAHYAELCYKAVKAIDPEATVLGVCSTGDLGLNASTFFREAGEAGAFKWLDAASFHPYQQPIDVPGKDGEETLANLRRICDTYRPGVPLWETEIYYINAFTPEQVEAFRLYRKNPKDPKARPRPDAHRLRSCWPAGNLVKRYAIDLGGNCVASTPLSRDQHLAMGAGRETSEPGLDVIGVPPTFAVNDRYFANAAFARYLEGARFLRKPDLPEGFNGFVFRDRNGRGVALVWRRSGEAPSFLKPAPGTVVRDLFGNRIIGDEINVSEEPVYFFLEQYDQGRIGIASGCE